MNAIFAVNKDVVTALVDAEKMINDMSDEILELTAE